MCYNLYSFILNIIFYFTEHSLSIELVIFCVIFKKKMIRLKNHEDERSIHSNERPRILTRLEELHLVQENNNIEELQEDKVLRKIMDIIAKLIFLVILYIYYFYSVDYI